MSGLIFVGSVMLQSAKGGLGAIGWASGSGDYASKKSLETTLKKVSWISGTIFVVVALLMPFIGG